MQLFRHSLAEQSMGIVIDGFTHRRGVISDAAEIRALTRGAYMSWVAILGREPLPMTADYADALMKRRFDLVCDSGKICALLETEPRGDSLWIENIAIEPALHGQGIGRALLDYAQVLAAEQGCKQITLCTNAKMTRNISIYKQYGFQIDREEAVSHGVVIYMSMQL